MKKLLLSFLFIDLFTGCASPNPDPQKEKQIISKNWDDWGVKAKAGDPGFYWTDDMVIMGPGAPVLKGKTEFLKMFSEMQKTPGVTMNWGKPDFIEISEDGSMAYLFAKNTISAPDSTGVVHTGSNQALQIWKKDKNGNWKAAVSVMYPDGPMK